MKKIITTFAVCGIAASMMAFTGCATLLNGTSENVTLNTVPTKANITITDSSGEELYDGASPAALPLKRGGNGFGTAGVYTVQVKAAGYVPVEFTLGDGSISSGPYLVGNGVTSFFFGVGLLGFVIDPITGAMWDINPKQLTAEQQKEMSISNNGSGGFTIYLKNSVPASVMEKATPLPVKATPVTHNSKK